MVVLVSIQGLHPLMRLVDRLGLPVCQLGWGLMLEGSVVPTLGLLISLVIKQTFLGQGFRADSKACSQTTLLLDTLLKVFHKLLSESVVLPLGPLMWR